VGGKSILPFAVPGPRLSARAAPANAPRPMAVIKSACINDLKMRVNLVDVVSRVVTLKKTGARFRGLCPFHQEKTPSFHVDPDKGFFKCFGCGKAGDAITFVRETEHLNFTEAVETLGQRFGVVIEYEAGSGPSKEERSLRQELFDLHDVATAHFHEAFRAPGPTGDYFRDYWVRERRFPAELADEFHIGAAPPDGGGLGAVLLKRGFSEPALRQCGLFFVRDDARIAPASLKPRFRGRLMIPIRDHQGRVVAFTARQSQLTPEDDPAREAKYVNSPETPIFSKSHLLFNLDRARKEVSEDQPFVLVEGQLDAMRCWQVGLKAAVAPQGTSVTEAQLNLLRRYHGQIECFFDGDAAGTKAALRLLPLALKAGLETRFLGRPGDAKTDPDELLREGGLDAYRKLRNSAQSAMTFACHYLLPEPDSASAEAKSRAAQRLFELIAAAESAVVQSGFLKEAAACLRLPNAALEQDFARFQQRSRQRAAPARPGAEADSGPAEPEAITPELNLLLLCLHHESLGPSLSHSLPHDWVDTGHLAGRLLDRFLAEFSHDTWPGRDHLESLLESPEERALVASLLFESGEIEDPVRHVQQALLRLRARALEPRLRQLELDLANHRADSNADPLSLAKELSELRRQLHQPIALVAAS